MRVKTLNKETSSSAKQTQEYKIILEAMKEESRKLKSEIEIENRNSLSGPESYIARLQDQLDVYSRKIKQEEMKLSKLDQDLQEVQREVKEKRKNFNTPKFNKTESISILNQKVMKTEHKLDKTLQHYNQSVAENKKLRDEIDKLRREKIVLKNIYLGIERDLEVLETERSELARQKEKNSKIKEEAKQRLEDLQVEREMSKRRFETLLEDLPKYEKKLEKEFKIQQAFGEDQNYSKDTNNLPLTTVFSGFKGSRNRDSFDKPPDRLEESQLQKQKDWVDIMNELVKKFRISENENNSLFNYVDDMTSEIEKLEKAISSTKQEIEAYRKKGIETEELKKRAMSELEVRISHTEARAEAYEKKHNKMMNTILSLKPGVENLLTKVGLTSNPLNDSTSSDKEFNVGNIVEYFNLIELRTSEIIQIYSYLKNPRSPSSPFEKFGINQKLEERNRDGKRFDIELLPVISDSPGLDDEANLPLTANIFFDRCIEREGDIIKKK